MRAGLILFIICFGILELVSIPEVAASVAQDITRARRRFQQFRQPTFQCPASAMSPARLNQAKEALNNWKDHLVELQTQLDLLRFVKANNRWYSSIDITAEEQAVDELQATIGRLQLCIFNQELQRDISRVRGTENARFLSQLQNVMSCFSNNTQSVGVLRQTRNIFDSIFGFFATKARSNDLTEEDCQVLRRTYSVWSSFYDSLNESNSQVDRSQTIPLYNVNPHNSSFQYWLREQANGNIPASGAPLLHADTHTDMTHVHMNPLDPRFAQIPFDGMSALIRASIRLDRPALVEHARRMSRGAGSHRPRWSADFTHNIISWLQTADLNEIRQTLITASQRTVHEIAQPVTGAVAAGITNDVVLALPPWSYRLPRTDRGRRPGRAAQLHIYSEFDPQEGHILFPGATEEEGRRIPGLTGRDSPLYEVDPNHPAVREVRPFTMQVTDLVAETRRGQGPAQQVTQPADANAALPDFDAYMPSDAAETGFILDIDLDAFVSNGTRNNAAMPISYGRSAVDHSAGTEMDMTSEVTTTEMDLIRGRIDTFFRRLEGAARRGVLPRVITIADSTHLLRAMDNGVDSGFDGGNFTPSCLAFLLNYMVRERLRNLYNISPQN